MAPNWWKAPGLALLSAHLFSCFVSVIRWLVLERGSGHRGLIVTSWHHMAPMVAHMGSIWLSKWPNKSNRKATERQLPASSSFCCFSVAFPHDFGGHFASSWEIFCCPGEGPKTIAYRDSRKTSCGCHLDTIWEPLSHICHHLGN